MHTSSRSFRAPTVLALMISVAGCAAEGATSANEDAEHVEETSSALSIPTGSVFAAIPTPPGSPEGIVVVGDEVFVAGPAKNGTAGFPPSSILVYDRLTGAQKTSIPITGEDTAGEHALSCITSDASDRLYVLSTQLGIVRLTRGSSGWIQDIYSPALPDIPTCRLFGPSPCSPTVFEAGPLPNDLAFDAQGNLYVTDSYQATIWKVAPGGGAPTVWFQSALFEGVPGQIGLNGLRVSPDDARVFVTVSLPLTTPTNGTLYSIPRVASPQGWQLRLEHLFGVLDGPDGIAFGATGNLFVNLPGTNTVAILGPNRLFEIDRYLGPAGSAIPFDGTANLAFDGDGSILVTNHAPLSNNASHFAVLKVRANDDGAPLFKPVLP